ncbi:MAG: gamma-glutamylcyclotransferase family protein [Thermoleophilaceae bacterium]
MGGLTQHVFGYASLVADGGPGLVTRMHGVRRAWGVAADNSRVIPGYKVYVRRSDRSRPALFVAFLDIFPDPGGCVNGVCRPVAAAELELLDRRERNYDRVDVTAAIDSAPGRVWAYVGSAAGRERLRRARRAGEVVISRDYERRVRAGFRALGEREYAAFLASHSLDGLPLEDLECVDVPQAPGGGERKR